MTIKIRLPNNVVIEAETASDLRSVLAAIGYPNGAVSQAPAEEPTITDRLRTFWDRLGSDSQRLALVVLAANPGGLKDDELRAALSFTSKSQLAGVLGGLAKNATAVNLRYENVLIKQVVGDAYVYRLTPEARDVAGEQGWVRKLTL